MTSLPKNAGASKPGDIRPEDAGDDTAEQLVKRSPWEAIDGGPVVPETERERLDLDADLSRWCDEGGAE